MEKKNARIGEKVIKQTIINEIEDKFFPTVVEIDPGRVHMPAVVVEKFIRSKRNQRNRVTSLWSSRYMVI